jgi:phosphatidylinositol glycan class Q protein
LCIGGIRFELLDSTPPSTQHNGHTPSASNGHTTTETPESTIPTASIYLLSVPLSFPSMFAQYFQLGQRIRKHYLSPRVLLCLATGKFVPPIHRKNLYSLQYSMLPARRAEVGEMWRALMENQGRVGGGGMNGYGGGKLSKRGSWPVINGGRRKGRGTYH